MILPIYRGVSKYPVFKNTKDISNESLKIHPLLSKQIGSINSEQDYYKKSVEQQERHIWLKAIEAMTLIFLAALLEIKIFAGLSKNKSKSQVQLVLHQFESLTNNSKIPTIDSCKSINKDLKEILKRQLNNAKANPEILAEAGRPKAHNRLLLFGPPGVGKSFFAKIFAKSLDAEYMEVMYSDFNSMWAGEGVDNLKKVFENIQKIAKKNPDKKYVVTFNEIDAIVMPIDNLTSSKGSYRLSKIEERSVFLNYIENLQTEVPNVTIIGTTNMSPKNNGLDRAAMSRFQNLTEVSYPDADCLYEALKSSLGNLKNSEKFINENENSMRDMAKEMADRKFSFRNLEYIVNDAKGIHLDEKVAGKVGDFKFEHLKKAKDTLKLSDGELEAGNIVKNNSIKK